MEFGVRHLPMSREVGDFALQLSYRIIEKERPDQKLTFHIALPSNVLIAIYCPLSTDYYPLFTRA